MEEVFDVNGREIETEGGQAGNEKEKNVETLTYGEEEKE